MRRLFVAGAIACLLGMAGCASTTGTASNSSTASSLSQVLSNAGQTVATVNKALCQIDSQAQPIAVALATPVATAVAPASASAVAGGVALDQTAIHPAIVAACAAVNGTPVGAVVAPAATPPAAAAPSTPAAATAAPASGS